MTDENTDIITMKVIKYLNMHTNSKSPPLDNLPMNYLNLEETNEKWTYWSYSITKWIKIKYHKNGKQK